MIRVEVRYGLTGISKTIYLMRGVKETYYSFYSNCFGVVIVRHDSAGFFVEERKKFLYYRYQVRPYRACCGDCGKEISIEENNRNAGVCDKCQYLYYDEGD